MAHEFLSDDWMDAVEALAAEAPPAEGAHAAIVLNIKVTDCPFGEREVHMNAGQFERGLSADAKTTVTVPYGVAKSLFVDGNPQAGMQAFMSGQIKVEGDMTALMSMQGSGGPSADQAAFQEKLKAITL